ncbi:restriction endonuclease subunit S [Empedobacter falsenii]
MEGLEISEIDFKDILKQTKDFRIDSEFFKKEFLTNDLQKFETIYKLDSVAKISDGDHSKFPENQKEEVRYLQAKDIKDYFIEDNNPVYISKKYFDKNKRSHIKEENVILSIMGSVGDIAITPKGFVPTLANRAVAIIKDINTINPYYLFAFMCSKFGLNQIERNKNGGVQVRINLDVLSKVEVPVVGEPLQVNIENLVTLAHQKRQESRDKYKASENLLLETIGLKDFQPSKEAVNIKSFRDSFANTGRLDAEYYQPKYEDYLNAILSKPHTFIKNEYIHIKEFIKRDTPEYNYIEIGDVNVNDGSCKPNLISLDDLPANGKIKAKSGDLLISKVRPYRGAVSIIDNEYENLVVSGAFTVLRINENSKYNNEVLKVILRSDVYKDWLLQFNVGTSYPVIKDEDIINLPIPFIQENIQHNIANLLNESSVLKAKSEHLLQVAKRAVEIAIEENEEVAINYINNNSTF